MNRQISMLDVLCFCTLSVFGVHWLDLYEVKFNRLLSSSGDGTSALCDLAGVSLKGPWKAPSAAVGFGFAWQICSCRLYTSRVLLQLKTVR